MDSQRWRFHLFFTLLSNTEFPFHNFKLCYLSD
jgi:hypothetical protein